MTFEHNASYSGNTKNTPHSPALRPMTMGQSPMKHNEQSSFVRKKFDTIWENNGGIDDAIKSKNEQEIVSIAKNNQHDQRMFDVYVSLKTMP